MNDQLELGIITQPYSAVYWGYLRRLVFGNSLTKHIKLSSFSYSVVIFFLPIVHIPPCFHANPPDFPRLIGPRVIMFSSCNAHYLCALNVWSKTVQTVTKAPLPIGWMTIMQPISPDIYQMSLPCMPIDNTTSYSDSFFNHNYVIKR